MRLTGTSSNVTASIFCTTPLSRNSKSAAVRPGTGAFPSRTWTSTSTAWAELRNRVG